MENAVFLNRDLSWLGFNGRVLMEAAKENVPILERIKFLSIYSSNLDEFYRVRIPVLMTVEEHAEESDLAGNYQLAQMEVNRQQQQFGEIICSQILPALKAHGIHWIYKQPVPGLIFPQLSELFFNKVLAYIQVVNIDFGSGSFFAENNKLYQLVLLEDERGAEQLKLLNIPSDEISRLYAVPAGEGTYVVFLEDIIRHNLSYLFPGLNVKGVYNLKITRDAALDIQETAEEDLTAALERQLERRDLGFATRLLCEPGIPLRCLYLVIYALNLQKASVVDGGRYHNLRDLSDFPLKGAEFKYPKWPGARAVILEPGNTLFQQILKKDLLVNVPYQNYDPILRFFNEAASDHTVGEIYVTLYRVASNSRIISALSTAARNGKKVCALVELKARFDEANNIKWAKKMKAAGVKIIYSSLELKVHAKVALVKRRLHGRTESLGLFATGNLNETTAQFYTDHVLLTANQAMLHELEHLFGLMTSQKLKPGSATGAHPFRHLLVAQFNMQSGFLEMIQREIDHAKQGLPASITIKLNNLEERILITKLYEASGAGVRIRLIVRGICCLIPGVPGLSDHIEVTRIVGRYLEHGRIFIFSNGGKDEVYMGSADWMNRNIYSRIEVCFPIYDAEIKQTLIEMINLQQNDGAQQQLYLFFHHQNALQT